MTHEDAVPCPDCAGRGRLSTDPLVLVYRQDLEVWDLPQCPTCAGHSTVSAALADLLACSMADLRRRMATAEQDALATLPDLE